MTVIDEPSSVMETHRNYHVLDSDNPVVNFYRNNHRYQTLSKAHELQKKYSVCTGPELSVEEALILLDGVKDASDPDTKFAQSQHAYQTAERIRALHPEDKELQLVGLVHDMGKILQAVYHEPDYFVVGDTFPLGCKFSDANVFAEFFVDNPDLRNPLYQTDLGIYRERCGFENVVMSYGHDQYLYDVCKWNGVKLSDRALYLIRFHSFYPFHKWGAYDMLASEKDYEMLPSLKHFQQFDLYSKTEVPVNIPEVKPYYDALIKEYFPVTLRW